MGGIYIISVMLDCIQAMFSIIHNFSNFLAFLVFGIYMAAYPKTRTEQTITSASNIFIIISIVWFSLKQTKMRNK